MQRVDTLLAWGANLLKEVSDIPHKEAAILLAHATALSRLTFHTHPEKVVEKEPYRSFVLRREKGEPIEYITHEVSFYGESFYSAKGALIARPETELLIDACIEAIKEVKNPVIVDVGTGSGVIAIMLAKLRPDACVYAIDLSCEALEIAKINCERFGVTSRVTLLEGDMLEGFVHPCDLLVSNPPYIPTHTPLAPSLSYEPSMALFGGRLGYEPYERLIRYFLERKIPIMACEMGFDQREAMINLFEKTGIVPTFYKDYSDLDRGFVAFNHP